MASQVTVEENSPMQVKETIESNINNDMSIQIRMSAYLCIKLHQKQRETKLQIQQILAAEAVAMWNLAELEATVTEHRAG